MLTKKALHKLIAMGEGYRVEFKESLPRDLARDLVGFANGNGGHVLLGVRDDGAIAGFKLDNRIKAQIHDVALNCDPPVTIEIIQIGDVADINVPEQNQRPYSCSSGFFIRNGAVTQKMGRDAILSIMEACGSLSFERRSVSGFDANTDLDSTKIFRFRREAGLPESFSDHEILVNLGLMSSDGAVTNACLLLFAKDPARFHPSHFVNCAVFKGLDRADIIDRKDFKGGLLDNLEDSWAFLKKHIQVRYEYRELRRIELFEIPLEALREALVNAIIHRDYAMHGANISVHLFDDRVEITSPGSFLKPITPENVGGLSLRRNELIADVFARLPYVEKMGTGIDKIRRLCRAEGIPLPEFIDNGFVTITFRRPQAQKRAHQTAQERAHQTAQEKQLDYLDHTGMQTKIVKMCKGNWFSSQEIASALGMGRISGQLKKNLRSLVNEGSIKRMFPGSPRHRRQKYQAKE
jgi:ATP-dependent DNA helicase RecG